VIYPSHGFSGFSATARPRTSWTADRPILGWNWAWNWTAQGAHVTLPSWCRKLGGPDSRMRLTGLSSTSKAPTATWSTWSAIGSPPPGALSYTRTFQFKVLEKHQGEQTVSFTNDVTATLFFAPTQMQLPSLITMVAQALAFAQHFNHRSSTRALPLARRASCGYSPRSIAIRSQSPPLATTRRASRRSHAAPTALLVARSPRSTSCVACTTLRRARSWTRIQEGRQVGRGVALSGSMSRELTSPNSMTLP
jgi:hypothetical protein